MKPARNDPCSCGSGKKYKHCCEGKVAPRSAGPSPEEFNQLVVLYNARRYTELESRTRALIGRFPDSGFAWKLLGASLQMQGKNALPAFQKTAELMPADAEAHFNLGVVLKSLGQLDDAVASYRRALKLNPGYAEAHSNLGNVLKDLGQLDDAVASYRRSLHLKPGSADAHNNLGTALRDLGQLDDALASYRHALQLNPGYAEAHSNLGNVLKDLGQLDDAVASYRRALQLKPDSADAHNNLGTALKDLGQLDDALASYRRAVAIKPNFADAYYNLGNVLKDLGQLDDAAANYRKAVEIRPDFAEAHNNLGSTLKDLGQLDAAADSYRRVITLKPDSAEAHNNLGNALESLGRLDDAAASYRRAVAVQPNFAEAYYNLGHALKEMGQLDDAVASYRKAVEIKPDFANAHNNLGVALHELIQFDEAKASYQRALKLNPNNVNALGNLGNFLKDTGQLDEAVASYQRALEIKPDLAEIRSNMLFALNCSPKYSPEYCLEEARQYGRVAAKLAKERFTSWQCENEPERLRVGIISGDLRKHPVGFFLESMLAQFDYSRIELIAYATNQKSDDLTARLRPFFSAWKPLAGMSDEDAARLIHADGVHILLDVSGHTAHNRLPVSAWKPAPIQASWLGYLATTGVAEMDYLLADEAGVPEVQRKQFTESIWYLPDTMLCFTAPAVDLPITPLPALSNGVITFGCFQNLAKVDDGVLTAWGEIFAALPDARLRMQCKQLGEPVQIEQMTQRLQRFGITPSRVTMHGPIHREGYLAAHAEVDLVLDTFPYTGCTTTCEALWMGVPTLTLAGQSLLARQGASLLRAAGLEEWVAASKEEYIAKAIALASDMPKLAALRTGLRQQVLVSPLFDAPRFARNFEDALWGMWRARNTQPARINRETLATPVG